MDRSLRAAGNRPHGQRINWLTPRREVAEEARMVQDQGETNAAGLSYSRRGFCCSAPPRLRVIFSLLVSLALQPRLAKADVTPEQVNAAINNGVAFLEKVQRPDGRFS